MRIKSKRFDVVGTLFFLWMTWVIATGENLFATEPSKIVQQYFRDALSAVGLTESDLEFKKDVVVDANLSPLVRTLLQHPLKMVEFVNELEQQLQREPWLIQFEEKKQHCHVDDWQKTPEPLRRFIQDLLDPLFWERNQFGRLLSGPTKILEQDALRVFAVENFHPDRDEDSLYFWTRATGGFESKSGALKQLLQRIDHLGVSETELIIPQLKAAQRINPIQLSEETRHLLTDIRFFVQQCLPWIQNHPKLIQFDRITLQTSLGKVILGGSGSQTYDEDAALIVDFGGDDHYLHAGCANGLLDLPFAVVIDLGGNDTYESAGSGIWGVGALWDQSGNDRYIASNASLGCGLFGVGVLVDVMGNDRYTGDTMCEGAAAFGYGLLWDGEGDDLYSVALQGQGFAGVNGYGVLCDFAGNDRYVAGKKYPDYDRFPERTLSLSQGSSMGYRPFAPGGLGILFDRCGDDFYECDVFGQGCSYWYSCGVLIDGGGNDSYRAYQYDQGSGIHLSVGILKDDQGDDRYFSKSGLAQGGSHDFGIGLLWDGGGNDFYIAASTCQGSAINNAVGLHYEAGGNDHYIGTNPKMSNSQGSGGMCARRGIGSIGVLLDMNGADRYSHLQWDNHVSEREDIGVAVDVASEKDLWEKRKVWATSSKNHRDSNSSLFTQILNKLTLGSFVSCLHAVSSDLSFLSSGEFEFGRLITDRIAQPPHSDREILSLGGDREMGQLLLKTARYGDAPWKITEREQAKKALEAIPANCYDRLLPWIGRGDVMNHVILDELIEKQGKAILPILRKFAASDWYELQSLCLYWLGEKGKPTDVRFALNALKNERVRPAALLTLSKLGLKDYMEKILPYLRSNRELERALTVRVLGCFDSPPHQRIVGMLDDPDWNVRSEVVKVLQKGGTNALKALETYRCTLSPLGQYWATKVKIRSKA